MTNTDATAPLWFVDSSTFINGCHLSRVSLFLLLRSPLYFSEYVFRVELSGNADSSTSNAAAQWVSRHKIGIRNLSLTDLDRITQLGAPRRIGLGEISSAILAEREGGGVLCDDWKGRRWLVPRLTLNWWESIEDVLLDAARLGHVSEFDLDDFQQTLQRTRYVCRFNLRIEHLRRITNQ